jgi:hypothetical protein
MIFPKDPESETKGHIVGKTLDTMKHLNERVKTDRLDNYLET